MMGIAPEKYNATFRRGLILTVMDEIRKQHATGAEVTNSTISIGIMRSTGSTDIRLRARVNVAVGELELAGKVKREQKLNARHNVFYKVITPC